MDIDEYEFEEELTLSDLADKFQKLAEELRKGENLEVKMPSEKSGKLELPVGEPVETGVEVHLRKKTTKLIISLGWRAPEPREEE
ncbi:amphi-Trp domain-containing protein [Candidatus Thorarchaeota archaeon]|nr:MAG: amphi-Trp domain-containing protein [Candidatus Thorarchaeota archaeon]